MHEKKGRRRRLLVLAACAGVLAAEVLGLTAARGDEPRRIGTTPGRRPVPADDQIFRPTVLIRRGRSQGSGTVIVSEDGETLILTAAHVAKGPGPIRVELHRYNLGVEHAAVPGTWPRSLAAELVASDGHADLAVLRIARMKGLPYVARLAPGDEEPARGTVVTSVGIDQGTHLSSWRTRVLDVAWIQLEAGGPERPFLLTVKPPEHGRSGGGLFREDGDLVGVCVGRAEFYQGSRFGIFTSSASIRRLLRDFDLDAALARADARGRRPARSTRRPAITPTRTPPSP
jgi:S1-C subfamily serine protease